MISLTKHLKNICLNYLYSVGLNTLESEKTLESLLYAEKQNVKTHGLNRIFSGFIESIIKNNLCESGQEPKLEYDYNGYILYDGNFSVGYYGIKKIIFDLITNHAYRDFIFCNVKNLYPTNSLAEYVEIFCNEGFICYITSKSPDKVSSVVDLEKQITSLSPVVGTNAYAWGFPSVKDDHVIFDVSMASLTNGDLLNLGKGSKNLEKYYEPIACLTKEFIPTKKWEELFDENGNFTGHILPFGGSKNHKGFGNLLVAEMFNFLQQENELNMSTTIILIKVKQLSNFQKQMDKFREKYRNSLIYTDGSRARLPFEKPKKDEHLVLEEYKESILNIKLKKSSPSSIYESPLSNEILAPTGRKIDCESPGGIVLQDLNCGKQIVAYGAATPFHSMLLQKSGLDTAWISSFEISTLLGEKDDENIGFYEIDFFVKRIKKKCPKIKLIIDCDTGWTNDEVLLSQYFRSWKSSVAIAVIQNMRTGFKKNSFSNDLNETRLESPVKIAKKLNIICHESINVLTCLRLENICCGQTINDTIKYIHSIYENCGYFDLLCLHSNKEDLELLKQFSVEFYKNFSQSIPLMIIPTAYTNIPNLLRTLSNLRYNFVIFANHAIRSEYKTVKDCYTKLAKGLHKDTDLNVCSMNDIFDLTS